MHTQLNDPKGALNDYNQAISLDPKLASAYCIRGVLKQSKLKDRLGAITDFRTAAKIYRKAGKASGLKNAIDHLHELGTTE